jgi:transposase
MRINKKDASSKVLDHLGLVAATIDKLGIAQHIDRILPMTKGANTTYGQRASAMIMNGLGFIDDRLYLFPKFLENKPVERLLGQGLSAEDFNDDALGRFLDKVHEYGASKLFSELALPIALKHKLLSKSVHFDTTSLSVYGEYEEIEDEKVNEALSLRVQDKMQYGVSKDQESGEDRLELAKKVKPEYGHAKNKRFDLKQMTLLLATTGASGFPIWMESHSGNASDKKTLEEAASRMQKFCKALESAPSFLYVGDSAMYANCVKYGNDLLWLSRVPENMKISQELLLQRDVAWLELDDGYKIHAVKRDYGGVQQRWVMVFSKYAYAKEIATLNKNIQKENDELTKTLWHLKNQSFGCQKDIDTAIKKMSRKLKYHQINYKIQAVNKRTGKGRPKKDSQPDKVEYKVISNLIANKSAIDNAKLTKGRFILATNQMDSTALSDKDILPTYKEQSGTESGFKFIKDDTFEVDSIFLKKPGRISALMMVMTLCLMVYSYAQYWLRQQLAINNETIISQSGKETKIPSMKWIYRLFHGVCILKLNLQEQVEYMVLNINDLLQRIILYFGEVACRIYEIDDVGEINNA